MPLRLYNTLTRRKEEFKPLKSENVRMYVCGPTVYDFAHIGNARPVIVFDVLFRLLRHLYGADHVKYVRNITDVDDKINARAREEGTSIGELTARTTQQFHNDVRALGVLMPEDVNTEGKPKRFIEPRATEHIAEMIVIIEKLIAKGHAYVADGHVLFDVPSMPDYGRLSRRSLDEMIAGARVDVAPYKRGDMDFVLWKPSDAETPGWDSPWSRGRPGWHIECSAMSWKHLGEKFDIHGGGIDLVFPHHENELAQTCCAFDSKVMANIWMHNGFLQVEGQKMSKSLGNFVTINELLSEWRGYAWPGQVIRLAMLATHYRQPLDFSEHALGQAVNALAEFAHFAEFDDDDTLPSAEFLDAICDDLNTPKAITELHQLAKQSRSTGLLRAIKPGQRVPSGDFDGISPHAQLAAGLRFLGIERKSYNKNWMQDQLQDAMNSQRRKAVDVLVTARLEARKAKNWAEGDRIRDELAAMGVAIKDNKDGTTDWEVKR